MNELKDKKTEDSTHVPPIPGGFNQVGVTVFADLKSGSIVLSVNNMAAVRLSLQGARDLAMLLRQKANQVERSVG